MSGSFGHQRISGPFDSILSLVGVVAEELVNRSPKATAIAGTFIHARPNPFVDDRG